MPRFPIGQFTVVTVEPHYTLPQYLQLLNLRWLHQGHLLPQKRPIMLTCLNAWKKRCDGLNCLVTL